MATQRQTTYHDTVSKMARKYSQYRLPQTSELIESDDDEYNNNNNNNNYGEYSNIIIDDEENEDIFSDSNTVILHKSISIHHHHHILFNEDESQKWDPSEVSLQEMEMRQAMEQMVDTEMQKLNASQELNEELERRMADPEFCNDLNAENWDYYEVAYWVYKIGYNYAIKRFFEQQIDGNVLLYDMNITMLINQLSITQLHSNKFMRSLYELKQKIFINKNKSRPLIFDYNINNISIKSDEFETKSTEKLLNLQREFNKTEEKFLKSQQEIVELKEKLNCIKNIHRNNINDINNKHNDILKEFERENNNLEEEIIKLRKIKRIGIDSNNFGSYSLSNYVQELQDKANDDEQNFAVTQDAVKWSCQEVAYWLTTIGMKQYLTQFMEEFVDGQILLNDINRKNLVSDLDVKSLHAPKIMRELNKLKMISSQYITNYMIAYKLVTIIAYIFYFCSIVFLS